MTTTKRTKEGYAIALIVLAFVSGMILTGMTAGCDSAQTNGPRSTAQTPSH